MRLRIVRHVGRSIGGNVSRLFSRRDQVRRLRDISLINGLFPGCREVQLADPSSLAVTRVIPVQFRNTVSFFRFLFAFPLLEALVLQPQSRDLMRGLSE